MKRLPPGTPVYLGSDHAGLKLKNAVKDHLIALGAHVIDAGAHDDTPSDYPDFVIPVAHAVAASKGKSFGIVFGGSGNGEAIAANKVAGIRAALCYDLFTAKKAREHNDANVLSLGARTVTKDVSLAKRIVTAFLTTPFSKDARHIRRIRKISKAESLRA